MARISTAVLFVVVIFSGWAAFVRAAPLGTTAHTATTTAAQIPANPQQIRDDLQAKRIAFEDRVRGIRQDADGRFTEQFNAFQAKLPMIRDDRRRQLTNRVGESLQQIHVNRIERAVRLIEALDDISGRLKTRLAKAKQNNFDVAEAETAFIAADTVLESARTKLYELSGKTYVIALTNETTLLSDIGATLDILKADAGNMRDALTNARDALKSAAVVLSNVPRIDEINEISESTSTVMDFSTSTTASTTKP